MQQTRLPKPLSGLRQPAYTGENRCLPCTAVNLLIATGLTAAVAVASPPVAVGVGVGSLLAIYVRGYLVPGTPELTKRYLPASVLARFGKAPKAPDFGTPFDVTGALVDIGALVDGPSDVALAPDFERAWRAEMADRDAYVPDTSVLADVLGVAPDDLTTRYHGGDACAVFHDGVPVGRWESAAAFNADMAAASVLDDAPAWESLPLARRGELLAALRACLERCPACSGPVELGTETVASCCSTREVVAAACTDCGARLFETDYDPAMAA